MKLRTATPGDAPWIDEQYEIAGFLPSDLQRDTVVIAEIDGQRAGLGRLVPAGDETFELGGMWVPDAFRGHGLARAIVDELIRRAEDAAVYCVPFANLEALYASAGFQRIARDGAPPKVQEKLEWCDREVKREVILMKLNLTRQ
jgi:N-acetylglutamate synthase-like GNAT family acetyltransferase